VWIELANMLQVGQMLQDHIERVLKWETETEGDSDILALNILNPQVGNCTQLRTLMHRGTVGEKAATTYVWYAESLQTTRRLQESSELFGYDRCLRVQASYLPNYGAEFFEEIGIDAIAPETVATYLYMH